MKLNKREIVFLAKELPQSNQLSLFANIKIDLDGSENDSLEEKGVLKAGKVTEEWKEAFEIIRTPKICSRIVLKDNELLVEKYAYKKKDKIVLVENDQGEMIVTLPENFDETIMELAEFTGMSNVRASNVEALLPINEILVLLGIADIYRVKAMKGFLGETVKDQISLADIKQQLEEPVKNSLLKMLVNNYNLVVPDADEVENILGKMIDKKIVEMQDGYGLQSEFVSFATSVLIPQTLVILEAFQIDENGDVITAGALCVSGGIKDAISFIFAGDEMEVSSITGSFLLKIIENYLNCPELI
ncbi:MAG TPA: hypothetical protein VFC41_09335, partial [Anaerovoracaceae bacterium]|nr:hypothetical protein [Anaerovoracaceae bacterium]